MTALVIGDRVRPTRAWRRCPQWQRDNSIVPSGRVRELVMRGRECFAVYLDSDHRAFVPDVFEVVKPRRRRKGGAR